jgi:hypothetical protein
LDVAYGGLNQTLWLDYVNPGYTTIRITPGQGPLCIRLPGT